jgi:tetratricopeptide (TPR) repeat protein
VPAGSYAFFVITGKTTWTLILNKDVAQMGTGANYKQELDVLRISAKPQAVAMRERLAYQFLDFDDFHATLALEWEKMRVSMPIKVDTDAQVQASITALDTDGWRAWNNAARWELESKKDYDTGLKLIEKSIQMKEDWLNLWTKAQLLAAKSKYKEAYPLAQRANELGQKAEAFFFADDVKKALTDWKGK